MLNACIDTVTVTCEQVNLSAFYLYTVQCKEKRRETHICKVANACYQHLQLIAKHKIFRQKHITSVQGHLLAMSEANDLAVCLL